MSIRRIADSERNASRTIVRETLSWRVIAASLGSRSPGARPSERICWVIAWIALPTRPEFASLGKASRSDISDQLV